MKRQQIFTTIAGIFLSGIALAHDSHSGFTIDSLQVATKAALDDFKKTNAAHVEHFTGYKSWISGEDSRVKIYVNHEGMAMEFNYLCHNHDEGIECHAQ